MKISLIAIIFFILSENYGDHPGFKQYTEFSREIRSFNVVSDKPFDYNIINFEFIDNRNNDMD